VRGRLTPAHCLPGAYEGVWHMHQPAAGLTAVGSPYRRKQVRVRLGAKQIVGWFESCGSPGRRVSSLMGLGRCVSVETESSPSSTKYVTSFGFDIGRSLYTLIHQQLIGGNSAKVKPCVICSRHGVGPSRYSCRCLHFRLSIRRGSTSVLGPWPHDIRCASIHLHNRRVSIASCM
jgi:hypothetical protein